MKIKCPYCFGEEFEDNQVHFRSEKVLSADDVDSILPGGFYTLESFQLQYSGKDKEKILEELREAEFFKECEDPKYENFWRPYKGSTEVDDPEKYNGILPYRRRVIDPGNPEHQKYLKRQANGGYLRTDRDGMVSEIQLKGGEICTRRVCPHCHNPLPDNFGKTPVKIVSIVGITGSGKTVYISQLLTRMAHYAAKVGLTAMVTTPSANHFIARNMVAIEHPLPVPTPKEKLQQPIFYELTTSRNRDSRETVTFVLFDVAGEVFNNGVDAVDALNFAPYVKNCDGLIILIDPLQVEGIAGLTAETEKKDDPITALQTLHGVIMPGAFEKCKKPVAVCLSKTDLYAVQQAFDLELNNMLLEEVGSRQLAPGIFEKKFHASSYNPIARKINEFIGDHDPSLTAALFDNYATYNFFGVTSLGCMVETRNGNEVPVGILDPKRIEEPLYWLFNKFKYIDEDEPVYNPAYVPCCPRCNSFQITELPENKRRIYVSAGFLKKKQVEVTHKCEECRCMFNSQTGEYYGGRN